MSNRIDDFWYDGPRFIAEINGASFGAGRIVIGEFESYDEALSDIRAWWARYNVVLLDPRFDPSRPTCLIMSSDDYAIGSQCKASIYERSESDGEIFPLSLESKQV